MDHFVRIIFEKKENVTEGLNESVFPGLEMLETVRGGSAFHIPLGRELSEAESDDCAERLANYMFEQGYDDFDIEITTTER